MNNLIDTNNIVKVYGGSHAYGTNIETSDIDIRGIFYANKINILTPFFPIGEASIEGEDSKFYELSKFMNLYTQCNPNIIELLWVDESDVLQSSQAYEYLKSYKKELLSSKVAFTFTGYAFQQLKRIKGHCKWINNPQSVDPPKQTDYVSLVHNFTDKKIFKINILEYHSGYRLIPYDGNVYGLYQIDGYETFDHKWTLNTTYDPDEHMFIDGNTRRMPLFIIKFNKEQYLQDKEIWKNYWTWKKNRNQARSKTEEEFGIDTKHAMHLIRLLKMGKEILKDGEVYVKRPDAKELLDIRNGKMTYNEIITYAEEMDNEIRNIWYKKTELPKHPNLKLAAKVTMDIYEMMWNGGF